MSSHNRNLPATNITTWPRFAARVRSRGCSLLKRLPEFTDPVLVAGCQRSGTTMLARIISSAPGMTDFRFGRDDELDAALILSGEVGYEPRGRHCFQTTYLNECVNEYLEHRGRYRLVWVIRNPISVTRSMVRNWRVFALNEMVSSMATGLMTESERMRWRWLGPFSVGRWRRACLAYAAKTAQIFTLSDALGPKELCVVDYDELVRAKDELLPRICAFAGVDYLPAMGKAVRLSSLASPDRLSTAHRRMVEQSCGPIYERALTMRTLRPEVES